MEAATQTWWALMCGLAAANGLAWVLTALRVQRQPVAWARQWVI
jgi:hypothetical protein